MTASLAIFALAAFFEIAGCFAFWLWARRGGGILVVLLGILSLIVFAFALTPVDSAFAGRAYARRAMSYSVTFADRSSGADLSDYDGLGPGRILIGFTPAVRIEQFFRDLEKRGEYFGNGTPQDKELVHRLYGIVNVGPPLKL